MSAQYMQNSSSGSQYYFNTATTTSSYPQPYQPYNSSGYSSYPTYYSGSRSPNQQVYIENSYSKPQQYQSVAGFSKTNAQQYYQSPQSPPAHLRPTVRAISAQDQYNLQRSPQPAFVAPQQHHFQFDTRQQPGRSTGTPVVYQTPGAAQFTHRNVDLWTESPSQGQDQYVHAQRVSVRSVATGSPQQSQSVSPQRPQDHLQQYYSQLTPEQHQHLLRQQQLQRQQEQNSHYEQQQQKVVTQSVSPPIQQRSTASFIGGQENQNSHPVGIKSLMNKFAGPTPAQQHHPRSKSASSRHYSSSSYTNSSGTNKTTTTTTRSVTSQSVTYSALPKPIEPPVNSVEYYQMQQLSGTPFVNIQQAAAPAHIQHNTTGLGALRDRFKGGSVSDDFNRPQQIAVSRQAPPAPQSPGAGNSLSSLRSQYMNQAKQSLQNQYVAQPIPNIPRTIVGEDIPQQKPTPKAPQPQVQPPAPVAQFPEKQPQPSPPVAQNPQPQPQPESSEASNQNNEQQAPSSEVTSAPTENTENADEGVSSF